MAAMSFCFVAFCSPFCVDLDLDRLHMKYYINIYYTAEGRKESIFGISGFGAHPPKTKITMFLLSVFFI